MALDTTELFSAGTGRIYRGATSAALPATITTAPSSSIWADLGYATVEGAGFESAPTWNPIYGWQSTRSLRQLKGNVEEKITATLLQLNRYTVQTLFGGGTFVESPTDVYTYTPPAPDDRDEFAILIDADDGDYRMRWYFQKVQNLATGQIMFNRENVTEVAIELSVLEPASGNAWQFQTNLPQFEDLGS